jgi:plastocyanin
MIAGDSTEVTMADWSIQIVPGANPGDPAVFVPQNQPSATPGGTLYADPGDAVSWDNRTGQNHQPLQTTGGNLPALTLGSLLWDPVTPGHQTAAWVVSGTAGTVITYTCLLHAQENGTITVT